MGEPVHIDVCPDCGTPDSGHPMDPPGHCPHQRGRFEPVRYVPESSLRDLEGALREIEDYCGPKMKPSSIYAKSPDGHALEESLNDIGDIARAALPEADRPATPQLHISTAHIPAEARGLREADRPDDPGNFLPTDAVPRYPDRPAAALEADRPADAGIWGGYVQGYADRDRPAGERQEP